MLGRCQHRSILWLWQNLAAIDRRHCIHCCKNPGSSDSFFYQFRSGWYLVEPFHLQCLQGYPFDSAVLEIPPTQTQRSTRISLPGNHLIKFQSTTAKPSSDVLLSFYFLCIHTSKIFLVFRFIMIWYIIRSNNAL